MLYQQRKTNRTNNTLKMYHLINNKESYDKLLKSGMFWEFYPELSGNWEVDILVINTKP